MLSVLLIILFSLLMNKFILIGGDMKLSEYLEKQVRRYANDNKMSFDKAIDYLIRRGIVAEAKK